MNEKLRKKRLSFPVSFEPYKVLKRLKDRGEHKEDVDVIVGQLVANQIQGIPDLDMNKTEKQAWDSNTTSKNKKFGYDSRPKDELKPTDKDRNPMQPKKPDMPSKNNDGPDIDLNNDYTKKPGIEEINKKKPVVKHTTNDDLKIITDPDGPGKLNPMSRRPENYDLNPPTPIKFPGIQDPEPRSKKKPPPSYSDKQTPEEDPNPNKDKPPKVDKINQPIINERETPKPVKNNSPEEKTIKKSEDPQENVSEIKKLNDPGVGKLNRSPPDPKDPDMIKTNPLQFDPIPEMRPPIIPREYVKPQHPSPSENNTKIQNSPNNFSNPEPASPSPKLTPDPSSLTKETSHQSEPKNPYTPPIHNTESPNDKNPPSAQTPKLDPKQSPTPAKHPITTNSMTPHDPQSQASHRHTIATLADNTARLQTGKPITHHRQPTDTPAMQRVPPTNYPTPTPAVKYDDVPANRNNEVLDPYDTVAQKKNIREHGLNDLNKPIVPPKITEEGKKRHISRQGVRDIDDLDSTRNIDPSKSTPDASIQSSRKVTLGSKKLDDLDDTRNIDPSKSTPDPSISDPSILDSSNLSSRKVTISSKKLDELSLSHTPKQDLKYAPVLGDMIKPLNTNPSTSKPLPGDLKHIPETHTSPTSDDKSHRLISGSKLKDLYNDPVSKQKSEYDTKNIKTTVHGKKLDDLNDDPSKNYDTKTIRRKNVGIIEEESDQESEVSKIPHFLLIKKDPEDEDASHKDNEPAKSKRIVRGGILQEIGIRSKMLNSPSHPQKNHPSVPFDDPWITTIEFDPNEPVPKFPADESKKRKITGKKLDDIRDQTEKVNDQGIPNNKETYSEKGYKDPIKVSDAGNSNEVYEEEELLRKIEGTLDNWKKLQEKNKITKVKSRKLYELDQDDLTPQNPATQKNNIAPSLVEDKDIDYCIINKRLNVNDIVAKPTKIKKVAGFVSASNKMKHIDKKVKPKADIVKTSKTLKNNSKAQGIDHPDKIKSSKDSKTVKPEKQFDTQEKKKIPVLESQASSTVKSEKQRSIIPGHTSEQSYQSSQKKGLYPEDFKIPSKDQSKEEVDFYKPIYDSPDPIGEDPFKLITNTSEKKDPEPKSSLEEDLLKRRKIKDKTKNQPLLIPDSGTHYTFKNQGDPKISESVSRLKKQESSSQEENNSIDENKSKIPAKKSVDKDSVNINLPSTINNADKGYQFDDEDSIGSDCEKVVLRESHLATNKPKFEISSEYSHQVMTQFGKYADYGTDSDEEISSDDFDKKEIEYGLIGKDNHKIIDREVHNIKIKKENPDLQEAMSSLKGSVFCLSLNEEHALVVARDRSLYKVPVKLLDSTTNYNRFKVSRVPLEGTPIDILHLGAYLAVCSNVDLCVLTSSDWGLVMHHKSTGKEKVAHAYRMEGRHLWGLPASEGSALAWWSGQTSFWIFAETDSGWRPAGKESLAAKGKIPPGVTGDSRAYSAVSFQKGYIILCICDDQQHIFLKPIEVLDLKNSKIRTLSTTIEQADWQLPNNIHVPSDISTLISFKTHSTVSVRGLALIPEGFVLVQWSKPTGTTFQIFTLRGSKATFVSSISLGALVNDVSMLDTIGPTYGRVRHFTKLQKGNQVIYGDDNLDLDVLGKGRRMDMTRVRLDLNGRPDLITWLENSLIHFRIDNKVIRIKISSTVLVFKGLIESNLCNEVWTYDAGQTTLLFGNADPDLKSLTF